MGKKCTDMLNPLRLLEVRVLPATHINRAQYGDYHLSGERKRLKQNCGESGGPLKICPVVLLRTFSLEWISCHGFFKT